MAHDVFISYAEEDNLAANITCNSLESERIPCWIAPRDVGAGAKWEQAIMDAFSTSRAMILVSSESANRSDHFQREVANACAFGITVIPFRISNTRPSGVLAYYLQSVQCFDAFTPPLEEHSKRLAVKVKAVLPDSEMEESGPMKIFRGRDRRLVVCLDVPTSDGVDYRGNLRARLDLGISKGVNSRFCNDENTIFGISHRPGTKGSKS